MPLEEKTPESLLSCSLHIHSEERPSKHTARKPQSKPGSQVSAKTKPCWYLDLGLSSLHSCEKINVKSHRSWCFVMAASAKTEMFVWFKGMSRVRLWAATLAEELYWGILLSPRQRPYAGNQNQLHSTLYSSLEAFECSLAMHLSLCNVANGALKGSERPGF